MSRLAIGVVAAMAVGLAVGIIGGIVIGEPWYHGGEIIAGVGALGLCALSLWKNPPYIADLVEGESESGEGSLNAMPTSQIEAPMKQSNKLVTPQPK